MTQQYDVVIAGAGPVGLAFAASMAGRGLRIALVDPQSEQALARPSRRRARDRPDRTIGGDADGARRLGPHSLGDGGPAAADAGAQRAVRLRHAFRRWCRRWSGRPLRLQPLAAAQPARRGARAGRHRLADGRVGDDHADRRWHGAGDPLGRARAAHAAAGGGRHAPLPATPATADPGRPARLPAADAGLPGLAHPAAPRDGDRLVRIWPDPRHAAAQWRPLLGGDDGNGSRRREAGAARRRRVRRGTDAALPRAARPDAAGGRTACGCRW